jgi:hypothetical protein
MNMKYGDLITFQPIQSVIQLHDADKADKAKEHVASYVISDEMQQRLCDVVVPQLQFDKPADNKGILIVGNYGTGKSHLLSVLSSVAENADMAQHLTSEPVAKAMQDIAGRFNVIRLEIGSTEMGLREIITKAVEDQFEAWGIAFRFPDAAKEFENKTAFHNMMAAYDAKFPGQGLLILVDELLDYLRSRKDQPLILDLGFLREVGEVCKDLRFRFVAGVQEAIFDSGRFSHVADSLGRVKDRFQQVKIATTDVKYVVSHRLLKKNPDQLAQIREYLEPFSKFYGNLNERMDAFADLFPIHPEYIDTFQRIPIVEKRGVLQIISDTIRRLVNQDVPSDHPGIVAYDSYWKALIEEPANRAHPEVSAIIECSSVLEAKIENAFTRPQYKPMARRIVDALSVHRLTTADLHSPMGLTPEEMRDGLCLYHGTVAALGGNPAEDLLTLIEKVLLEVHKTVSGQFISSNKDNRQYYLDLKKVDDYDALVEKRCETLDDNALDRYYYDALTQVLECADVPVHVTNYQIWQHEVEWREKKAPRLGYLFFGAPNERSTAIPQRDFYLYFIQPFNPPRFTDSKLPDEVFFRLAEKGDDFEKPLKLYAAALELASTSSGIKRETYRKKASEHLGALTSWLRDHLLHTMDVTYQGQKKKLTRWLAGTAGSSNAINVRDTVNSVASVCLAEQFSNQAPAYPSFSVMLRTKTIPQAAQDAIRGIAQPATRTKQATAVLDALELLDGDTLAPGRSQYARYITDALLAKGQGQVLNRQELIKSVSGIEYFVPEEFRLEQEWAVVLLASLVYAGDIVLSIPGKKFDATALATLATTDIDDLKGFKHVERPKDWNVPALKVLFELVELAPGLAVQVTQGDAAPVQEFNKRVLERVEKLVMARQQLLKGIPFWGQNLFSEAEAQELSASIDKVKAFLESMQAYNAPGKLKNLKVEVEEIEAHKPIFAQLKELEALEAFVVEIGQFTQYLSMCEGYLPDDHEWSAKSKKLRDKLLANVRDEKKRASAKFKSDVLGQLQKLKEEYIQEYMALHKKARLSHAQDDAKSELMRDYRLAQLQALTAVELLNRQQLIELQDRLGRLKPCWQLTQRDLASDPKCPHCGFWPGMEPVAASVEAQLPAIKDTLAQMQQTWTQDLLNNLTDPVVQNNLGLLKPKQKKLVTEFVDSKELPDHVSQDFVKALQEALTGLSKVSVSLSELKNALMPEGSPATPAELRDRFEQFVTSKLSGKDASKVRIVVE